MSVLREAAARTRAFLCLECGKCTPACPVAEHIPRFSPHGVIETTLHGEPAAARTALRSCLACGACEARCPSAVHFTDFVLRARAAVPVDGEAGPMAHGSVFRLLPVVQAGPGGGTPDRLGWLTPDLRTAPRGEVLYFAGCAPLFDSFFGYLAVETVRAARAAVRLMNALGVEPVVLADEVCCGHDRLFSGDAEGFRTLARRNAERIAASGARTVVTSCAECARCLGLDYPAELGALPFRAVHLARWLVDREGGPLPAPGAGARTVTFQDACRLGRHLQETEAPRALLSQAGARLLEMAHHGRDARCCGTEGFDRCGAPQMAMQAARLEEAAATGADVLVTACPKCLVHLRCAQRAGGGSERARRIEILDLGDFVAGSLPATPEGP